MTKSGPLLLQLSGSAARECGRRPSRWSRRFDSAVAATSMHWVDLPKMLPRLGHLLEPGGRLAVWRTVFGDPRVRTPFRRVVDEIAVRRGTSAPHTDPLDPRPTVKELEAGGTFRLVGSWQWPWQIDLTAAQLRALFATFSDWRDPGDLDAVQAATEAQGGLVTEHYVTILHLLRSTSRAGGGVSSSSPTNRARTSGGAAGCRPH